MENENAFKIIVQKPAGKRTSGKRKCRCEDSIKMDVTGCRYDLVGSTFADRKERLSSIEVWIFLEQQSNCQLFKNDSVS
jgi:hypothetical protein